MEQKPTITAAPESEPILTFEEFIATDDLSLPRYNNLYFYFSSGGFADTIYKKTKYYMRLEKEYPDIVTSLCNKVQNMSKSISTAEALKPFERELYEVYKIMREFSHNKTE